MLTIDFNLTLVPVLYNGDLYKFWIDEEHICHRVELFPNASCGTPHVERLSDLDPEVLNRFTNKLAKMPLAPII